MKVQAAALLAKSDIPDKSVFLVYGGESRMRSRVVSAVQSEFLDAGFGDFDGEVWEASTTTVQSIASSWRTMPLASKRRVVTIRNLHDLKSSDLADLTKIIAGGSQKGCLLLDTSDDSGKEFNALLKAVDAAGVAVQCSPCKPDEAIPQLIAMAEQEGVKIDNAAASEMVRRLGTDLWQLQNELTKLINYVHPAKAIRRAEVDLLIRESPEDKIFAMIDALCDRRGAQASEMLDDLFAAGDDERGDAHRVLAVLARHFRLLWQARVLKDKGYDFRSEATLPHDVEDLLPRNPNILEVFRKTPFLQRKYAGQLDRFDATSLANIFGILAECDLALKGRHTSVGSPREDMQMTMTRIAQTGSQKPRR